MLVSHTKFELPVTVIRFRVELITDSHSHSYIRTRAHTERNTNKLLKTCFSISDYLENSTKTEIRKILSNAMLSHI